MKVGGTGGEIHDAVQDVTDALGFKIEFNAGHQIATDEWTNSFIEFGSKQKVCSGIYFQADHMPMSGTPLLTSYTEDNVVVADEKLRGACPARERIVNLKFDSVSPSPIFSFMPQSTSPRLDQLDKNFQDKSGGTTLKWLDAFDPQLALRGLAWPAENRRQKNFRRLPDRAETGLSEGVRFLSHCPSSVFLSFFTNSTAISVRLTVADLNQMNHMPATGMSGTELYFREGPAWHPVATAAPSLTETSFTSVLTESAPRRRREYRLYLPLYKKVESVALGFEPRAIVEPAPAPKATRPVFFYGTSITQGGCANTAGSDYVSTIGRLLDAEVVNFGFSGNGKGEPEVARLIREVRVRMFVLDHSTNCKLETLAAMLPEFVRILREKHPVTPIVLISCPAFNQILLNAKTRGIDRKRDIVMRFYLQAKKSGDANIHYIDGPGLLPAGLTGTYVDGVHPTSGGFALIAERLAQQLRPILSWIEVGTGH